MSKKSNKRNWLALPLCDLIQARSDARKYKRLYTQEFVEHQKAKRKAEAAAAETDYYCGLVEFVGSHVLNASTVEELASGKSRYNDFARNRAKEYADKRQSMRRLAVVVNGKLKCLNAW